MTSVRTTIVWSVLTDLVYLAVAPFAFIYLCVSGGLARQKVRRGLLAKLWKTPRREGNARSFWVHAVSVGEVITAVPLVEELRRKYPSWDVRVSVSTFTGYEVARDRLPDLAVFYSPLDLSLVVGRFFRRHRPTVVLLVELELWPNFLLVARRRGVPVLVANARITERSARRYARAGFLSRGLFDLAASFGAQDEAYRERFLSVGVRPEKIEVLGNLKHDREPSPAAARGDATRDLLGWGNSGTVVLVAGSTHPDEETTLCAVVGRLRARHPGLRLVVAPRHVERLDDAELARWKAGAPLCRWSRVRDGKQPLADRDGRPPILVVDTLGELEAFYSLADVVFVGGSLVPHGGQNLLEAARLGKPVLFGPSFQNFQREGDLLLSGGGGTLVGGEKELESRLDELVGSADARREAGRKALEVTTRLRGATSRHLEWIERHLQLYLQADAC